MMPGVAATPERLRATFDEAPELYDRARPSYPAELVDDLAALAGIGPGSRVLEIGPGPGKLTVPLARLGCRITAVELGQRLAAVARRNLADLPDADVVVSAFEDWPLPGEPFDAVVSASAFHWIDPAIRVIKSADALREGGALATVGARHVAGGTAAFFADVQACYERWDPDTPAGGTRLPAAADIQQDSAEIDESGRFGSAVFRRFERDLEYTTAAHLDTLRTYSVNLAMDPARREGLLGCIGNLIDSRYGGRITMRYLFELRLARRR